MWYTVSTMHKRSSKQGSKDVNEIAFRVFQEAVGETVPNHQAKKNPAAVELGRLGGLRGGKARALKLEPERRREIARLAAIARWSRLQGSRGIKP